LAGLGEAGPGEARQGGRGWAWRGEVGRGEARLGLAVEVTHAAAGTASEQVAVLDAYRVAVSGWAPPPDLTVSEFCDEHLIVTAGPLEGSRWRTAGAEYQRGILDAFHEPGVEIVVVKSSSQVGKTAIALAIVAYHIAHDPCPILVVEPTVKPMAEDFSTNRLEPLIDNTPTLAERVGKKRAKDSKNTILAKTFTGGSISIGGANSAASLAQRTVRLLLLDEIDRYPPELPGEGATIEVAIKRTTTFRGRRRIMLLSTPTLENAPIDSWHRLGDQRRFYVPCPGCGVMHPYEWRNVQWRDRDPLTARLVCPECAYEIGDAERVAALEHGEWIAEHPDRVDRTIVSFHLWEAYSPFSSLAEIVSSFLRAREKQKEGDRGTMHTWENTTLGETSKPDAGAGVEPSGLLARREPFPAICPPGVACITLGVDTQDDRLEAVAIGWGPGEEAWLIHRETIPGDTSQAEPWAQLDELLEREYPMVDEGRALKASATCIDSAGHRTNFVYEFVHPRQTRRVYAIIGRDGDRLITSSPSPRRWGIGQRKVPLYTIGVDSAKALIMNRLALTERGRGYVHLPAVDWCDDEFAAQLTSERLMQRFVKGVPVNVWRKIRTRNEALDCSVYALAALRILRPNLEQLAQRVEEGPVHKELKPRRAAFMDRAKRTGKKRESWMKRQR